MRKENAEAFTLIFFLTFSLMIINHQRVNCDETRNRTVAFVSTPTR